MIIHNTSLSQIIESVQYNATLAITCAIHGSSHEKKLYQELGLESLHDGTEGGTETSIFIIK